jgi:hypothetical protein
MEYNSSPGAQVSKLILSLQSASCAREGVIEKSMMNKKIIKDLKPGILSGQDT